MLAAGRDRYSETSCIHFTIAAQVAAQVAAQAVFQTTAVLKPLFSQVSCGEAFIAHSAAHRHLLIKATPLFSASS